MQPCERGRLVSVPQRGRLRDKTVVPVEKGHQPLNIKNNQHHRSSRWTFRTSTGMDFNFDSGMRVSGYTLGEFRVGIPAELQMTSEEESSESTALPQYSHSEQQRARKMTCMVNSNL